LMSYMVRTGKLVPPSDMIVTYGPLR
jgi:hypothetical protein